MAVRIDIVLLLTLCISTSLCAVLKSFNFQCYTRDICVFPAQFCSSAEHLKRCMPCTIQVCEEDTPPLQCAYNCSIQLQEKAGSAEDSVGLKEPQADSSQDNSNSKGWKIALLIENVVLVIVVVIAFFTRRWLLSSRTEKTPADQEQPLVNRGNQNDGTVNNNGEVRAELSSTPIEAEQIGSNNYRPVTNLTRMDSNRSG